MATQVAPTKNNAGHSHQNGVASCPLFRLLPEPLQQESRDKEFLLNYIHNLPMEEIGVPEFYPKLERQMGDMKDPNLIYPIGGGLYVHVMSDLKDSRDIYIPIEPGMEQDNRTLMEELEERLVDYVADLESMTGDLDNRAKVLRAILTQAITVDGADFDGADPDDDGESWMRLGRFVRSFYHERLPAVTNGDGGYERPPGEVKHWIDDAVKAFTQNNFPASDFYAETLER